MKKLFALLLLLASTTMFGQVIVHNQPVKLKVLTLGTSSDSLVVVDGAGLTKYLPISDIEVTKLPWLSSTNTGEYAWEVDGNRFVHNYGGNTLAPANPFYSNTFIGINAGNYTIGDGSSTIGEGMINVGVGAWALNSLTTGSQNVMIGNEAGALMTTSGQNVGIGDGAFYYSITGVSNNMGLGKNVFQNLTSGVYNVGIGRNSGFYVGSGSTEMSSGSYHTLIGADTRPSANGTTREIVIGEGAVGGGSNTAVIGDASITKISAGVDYTAVDARDLVTKGYADATYLGGAPTKLSWLNTTNTGQYAWEINSNPFIHDYTGNTDRAANPYYSNTFVGEDAGNYSVGDGLTGLGVQTGLGNVGVGAWSLNALTTGGWNIAIGTENLGTNTTGFNNTAIGGGGVMYYNTTGSDNTAIGAQAMIDNISGSKNVAIGKNALGNLTTGTYNTAVGENAGLSASVGQIQTNTKGVFIGNYAKASANGTTNEIVIGEGAIGRGSNTAIIGDNNITKVSAGADFVPVDAQDLVTKGYADATYSGGGGVEVLAKAVSYAPVHADNGKHIDFSAGTVITLDDAGVTVNDQFTFFNNTGSPMSFAYGTGDAAIQGTIPDIADGSYGWATLKAANSWSVVVGGAAGGGGGGDVTKVGIPANDELAIWTGDGTLEGESNLIFDGTNLTNLAGGIWGVTSIAKSGYSGTAGHRIFNSSNGNRADFISQSFDTHSISPQNTNGVHTELNSYMGDLVIGATEVGKEVKLVNDPTTGDGIGNRGYNDLRYMLTGGGLANVVEDLTPTLGGALDVDFKTINNGRDLYFDSNSGANDNVSIGNIYYRTFADTEVARIFVRSSEMSLAHTTNIHFDVGTGGGITNYDFTPTEANFDRAVLSDASYEIGTQSITANILSSQINSIRYSTSASAITLTIPDTLTEVGGTHITFVQEGAGALTVAVSGTATLNGVTAGSLTLNGQYSAVELIQRVASSDDWIAIGDFTMN